MVLRSVALVFLLSVLATNVNGGVILSIRNVGNDVVASTSGSINTSGLFSDTNSTLNGQMVAQAAAAYIADPSNSIVESFHSLSGIVGPMSFGPGNSLGINSPTTFSGDPIGINGSMQNSPRPNGIPSAQLWLPFQYVSGSPVLNTAVWNNQSLAGLGLTTGTYRYTWGSGSSADFFEVQVGVHTIPEPSSVLVLLGLTLVLGGTKASRRTTKY